MFNVCGIIGKKSSEIFSANIFISPIVMYRQATREIISYWAETLHSSHTPSLHTVIIDPLNKLNAVFDR